MQIIHYARLRVVKERKQTLEFFGPQLKGCLIYWMWLEYIISFTKLWFSLFRKYRLQ